MQRIEFLNYGTGAYVSDPLWGVRIDGTDLRTSVAEATRELWRQEHEEDTPAEQERFLLGQHNGLITSELGDPVRHFLGDPGPEFADAATGRTPVLGCSCGVWGCWPLVAVITATPHTVTWSSFRQPFRAEWGELALGPYVFDRTAYESALAAPVRLGEDPLRAGDEEDGDDGADEDWEDWDGEDWHGDSYGDSDGASEGSSDGASDGPSPGSSG
ncbi:hypothetical protein [Streptomyces sp. NA04227]|uniref:hypothetical protein n=1 Tax=Streptomyces sp. NA04227 TaxID=2742136 RepID=UPI0020CA9B5F|nr:hypothetical protein [Streptomyces sp. NA04227]